MDTSTVVTPPLIFVRHGETDWNAAGRLQGHIDIALNAKGREQALRNGRTILEKFPDVVGYDFVASPLSRARESMEIIRETLGLEPKAFRLEDRLKEISHGDWEGSTGEELQERSPELVADRLSNRWEFVPPNGESYKRLLDRVVPWLVTVERPTLVVSHGGVGRVLRCHILGVELFPSMTNIFSQDNAFHWRDGIETLI
jgi:broad specificity phosphatase PhoE